MRASIENPRGFPADQQPMTPEDEVIHNLLGDQNFKELSTALSAALKNKVVEPFGPDIMVNIELKDNEMPTATIEVVTKIWPKDPNPDKETTDIGNEG
jgi:hypothetical protein